MSNLIPKLFLFSLLLLPIAMAQGAGKNPIADSKAETARLHAWLDEEFKDYLDFSPLTKSRYGDKSDYGELDDASIAHSEKVFAWREASVARMKEKFDRNALDEQGKISWDLWQFLYERSKAGQPYRYHRYIFGRRGPHTSIPRSLISNHKVDDKSDMRAYISRLKQVDRYLGQYLTRAKHSAELGIRAPYFDYDIAISQSKRVINGAPFVEGATASTALWTDITGKIAALEADGKISKREARRFNKQAKKAMLKHVLPAYENLIAWLEDDIKHTTAEARGASSLPDGDAYYQYALTAMTTLPLTADQIHAIGLREVARIHKEMNEIKNRVGFDGSLQEFFVFMRTDPQFYFPSTDEGREKYLQLARDYVEGIKGKLPEYFGILPKADLEVKRVESYREQAGGAAHYFRGTPDGSRPGVFYAHLIDMQAAAVYRLENLTYHEGIPGHHMQLSIQQELEGIPRFRTHHGYTAFSEGWGLYAEYLGKDMGFYKDDYADFGRLTGELWRAIRLVVDTGIHAKQWSEARAVNYGLANSPDPAVKIRSEIRRYFNNPAQATAYKIGMLKILELRDRAQQQLGDKFDYRGFHDTVLGSGALPLPILENQVNAWIIAQLAAAN